MMMNFEKLETWKLSISFSTEIYRISSAFPSNEIYGITSQIRRASCSISLNIAEGSGRGSDKEYARFIGISIGSTLECIAALHICKNLDYIDEEQFSKYYQQAEVICKKLYSLKKYLKNSQH